MNATLVESAVVEIGERVAGDIDHFGIRFVEAEPEVDCVVAALAVSRFVAHGVDRNSSAANLVSTPRRASQQCKPSTPMCVPSAEPGVRIGSMLTSGGSNDARSHSSVGRAIDDPAVFRFRHDHGGVTSLCRRCRRA